MKKIFVVAIGIALCFGFAASASAFEGGSLESQTTFTLYDKDDPFDLTIDPGLLDEIDRWRLYTNLSNYEDADAYYLIGTSGKIGPGSLAIIYETTKDDLDEDDLDDDDWDGTELRDNNTPPGTHYDGIDDRIVTLDDSRTYRFEEEVEGLYLSYSVDLGKASLGAGLDYTIEDVTTESLDRAGGFSGVIGGNNMGGNAVDWNPNPAGWGAPMHNEALNQGNGGGFPGLTTQGNYSRRRVTTNYGTIDHSKYNIVDDSDSFSGDNDIEDDSYVFTVSSLIHVSDEFEIQATAGYEDVDVDASGSARYNYTRTESQTGTSAPGELQPLAQVDGYLDTRTETSTWNGNFMHNAVLIDDSYSHDGDGWSLELEPSYELNEVTRLELRLGYETADGDADGGWTQNVTVDRSQTLNAADTDPRTWAGTQTFNNTWSGDWDADYFSIEPRIYLTYGPVEFSLGVGYSEEDKELDGRTREDMTASWAYQNGDGVANAADWTFTGSATSYTDWKLEDNVEAWSFPVGTRFNVTDKLTFRAGARFTRETHERTYSNTFVGTEDERWTITDGTGTVVDAGADNYTDTSGNLQPYDRTSETDREGESQETEIDTTEYRLGLGYQVTEHLAFDLMFASETGAGRNGGVNTKVVYASAVLAF